MGSIIFFIRAVLIQKHFPHSDQHSPVLFDLWSSTVTFNAVYISFYFHPSIYRSRPLWVKSVKWVAPREDFKLLVDSFFNPQTLNRNAASALPTNERWLSTKGYKWAQIKKSCLGA